MTREWLYLCLRPGRPGDDGIAAVRAIAGRLRAADRSGRWAFQRLVDHDGPHIGLWLFARAEVLRELRAYAHRTAPDQPVGPRRRHTPVGARYLGDVAARTATELSLVSSEFALDLLAAGRPEELSLAAVHLVHLTGLMPAGDRAAFLFQCWLHRAAELSAEVRHDLMRRARAEAGPLLDAVAAGRWRPGQLAAWGAYVDRLARAATGPGELEPPVYVIFDHAHLTHNRLGIGAAEEALAAQVVRTALLAGLRLPRVPRTALRPAA